MKMTAMAMMTTISTTIIEFGIKTGGAAAAAPPLADPDAGRMTAPGITDGDDMQDPGRAIAARDHDVVLAADFTMPGDRAFRLAEEIQRWAEAGRRVGLVQHCAPAAGAVIAAPVRALVRRGLARVADPQIALMTQDLVVHEPARADWTIRALAPLAVAHVVLVAHAAADLTVAVPPVFRRKTQVGRVAVNEILAPGRPAWLPPVRQAAIARRDAAGTAGIGWYAERIEKATTAAIAAALDGRAARHIRLLGPEACRIGPPALPRLVAGLDVLVVPEQVPDSDLPDTLVAAMLAAGREVVAPRHLRGHYGAGPRYATSATLPGVVAAAVQARRRMATAGFAQRAAQATPVRGKSLRAVAKPARDGRPVLFLPSNGVGVGHLTRLLAVARRMEGHAIFASHAAALDVIRQFGFPAEYLPSSTLVGGDFDAWDRWFRHDLDDILDRHDPKAVIYDGNLPSPGLIGAVAPRGDCRFVWMRRGMWARTTSPHIDNARWFDLILEPGELAQEIDTGITAQRRHEAEVVAPIRLLDEGELLARAEAAAALGLDPTRPAVLVQLGSGFNRDLLSILDQIMAALAAQPGLQIAIAEWVTGTIPLTLWPRATILRGFPISQYLRAFDFCISAAGYNSYHELLGFGVPTIFVANRHPTMDDQLGRARFAQSAQAAFEIGEDELEDLPEVLALMMQEPARAFLAAHCRALIRANGADQAAARLSALPGSPAGKPLGANPGAQC